MVEIISTIIATIFVLIIIGIITIIRKKTNDNNTNNEKNINNTIEIQQIPINSKNKIPKEITDDNKYFFLKNNIPGLTYENKIQILKDAIEPDHNNYFTLIDFIDDLFKRCLENDKLYSAELCQKPLKFMNAYMALNNYDLMQEHFYNKKDITSCEHTCLKALSILPAAIWYTQKNISEAIIYLGSIKRLSIIYKDKNEYDKVASLARLGVKLNLSDGTKGGFQGRYEFARTKTDELYPFEKEIGYNINFLENTIEKNFNYKKEK